MVLFQQPNNCDCGVYTMLFADYAARGAAMDWHPDDVNLARAAIDEQCLLVRAARAAAAAGAEVPRRGRRRPPALRRRADNVRSRMAHRAPRSLALAARRRGRAGEERELVPRNGPPRARARRS